MRYLALIQLGSRSASERPVPGLRALALRTRPHLIAVLVLSLALISAACGSRVATSQPHATASASPTAQPATSVSIGSAQLVAGSTGWILSDHALSLTTDGGQTLADITPPGVSAGAIRGVYFMDTQHGWAVSSSASNSAQLEISATADGGSSWSTSDLGGPAVDFADSTSAPAYIDFVDAQHGWVMLLVAASDAGDLFQTPDGGKTWQQLPRPVGGRIEFVSPTTGWLTSADQQGTTFTEKIYVTSDGGQQWATETVTPPAGFTQDQATYTIPAFTSPTDVMLAAFDNGTSSAAGFYQTDDNGMSWQLKATVPAGKPAGDVSPSAAVISKTDWVAVSIYGTSVTDVTQAGAAQTAVSPVGLPPDSGIGDASFTSTRAGWVVTNTSKCAGFKTDCTETTALYGTSDGGAHWTQLAGPPGPTPSSASATATP